MRVTWFNKGRMYELVPLARDSYGNRSLWFLKTRIVEGMARPEFSFALNERTSRWEVMYWPPGGTEIVVRDYPSRTEAAEHVAYANSPRRPSSLSRTPG